MQTMTDSKSVMRPEVDVVGAETLERLGAATAFNRWMFERLAPWIGPSVLEVGAGVGNLSQFLEGRKRVVLSDMDPVYLQKLRDRFGSNDHIDFRTLALPDATQTDNGERFSSIVCLNVVEHVEDDVSSLREMGKLLEKSGRLIILVPAFPFLYGTLDTALGHYRRYTKGSLNAAFSSAGLKVRHMEYFNLAAMPGWWFTGQVLKKELIPAASLNVFERMIPLFRLEKFMPWRIGQSLIAVAEVDE